MIKHKIIFFSTIGLILTMILFLGIGIWMTSKIDVQNEIEKILQYENNEDKIIADLLNLIKGSANIKFLAFIFSFEGFSNISSIHGANVSFAVMSILFVVPFLGILTIFFVSNIVFSYIVGKITREYKYIFMKNFSKYTLFVSLSLFAILLFVGSSLLVSSQSNVANTTLNNLFLNENNYKDIFDVTSILGVIEGGMIPLIKGDLNNTALLLNNTLDINISNMSAGIILLVIVLPVLGIVSLFTFSSWIATYISAERGGVSRFKNWLGNSRIDSMREFRASIKNNVWFILVFVMFIATIIFPGIIHNYKNTASIVWTVIISIIGVLAFIPTYIGIYTVKKLRMFNYNLMMFIQLWILFVITFILNIVAFALYKDILISISYISIFYPMIIIFISIIGFLNFVRQKR